MKNHTPALKLAWRSIDSTSNRRRWYYLATESDLWGDLTVVRRWGRLSGQHREAIFWPEDAAACEKLIEATRRARTAHRYQSVRPEGQFG